MHSSKGSRIIRLLKRTSDKHQPKHLALAVALGLLAGLIPKANLLAVCLYAAIFFMPLHIWLALVVSLLATCVSGYLDPLTHAIGAKLLALHSLRPFWYRLDAMAIVPWLSLHNTVVLGNLLLGLVFFVPSYLIAFRIFEATYWAEKGTVRGAEAKPIQRVDRAHLLRAMPASRPTAVVPPPKGHTARKQFLSNASSQPFVGDEPIEFEPVDESSDLINQWHMGDARRRVPKSVSVGGPRQDHGRVEVSPAESSLPPAHTASEVLAWIDEAIDQCMAQEGPSIVSLDPGNSLTAQFVNTQSFAELVHRSRSISDPSASAEAEYWLMETTTEIVRWADESNGTECGTEPNQKRKLSGNMETNTLQSENRESRTDSNRSAYGRSGPDTSPQNATTIAEHRVIENQGPFSNAKLQAIRRTSTGFEQVVIANTQDGTLERATLPMEPHRGECLGYLLGHLRQTREGRST